MNKRVSSYEIGSVSPAKVMAAWRHNSSHGESRIRAALSELNVKEAYVQQYIDDIVSGGDLTDYVSMDHEAIQADYQLYVASGGLA